MANHQMSVVVAVVLLVLSATAYVQGRTVSSRFAGLEKDLTDASAASAPPRTPQVPQPVGRSLAKRSPFDPSCKGSYDRNMYRQLDRVCDDCYNLYRKPYVEIECSRNCFRSEMFQDCVLDLQLDFEYYLTRAQKLQGFD